MQNSVKIQFILNYIYSEREFVLNSLENGFDWEIQISTVYFQLHLSSSNHIIHIYFLLDSEKIIFLR